MLETENDALLEFTRHSLFRMIDGGMYDLVAGGFCRYSTDEDFLIPHFEKMLYDNAAAISLYAKAYGVFGEQRFLEVAKECAAFLEQHLKAGSFYGSAMDADTDEGEGAYYTYSYSELEKAGVQLEKLAVFKGGNFEGRNIIRFKSGPYPEWESDREKLASLRKQRSKPAVDKKAVLSWNAMAINGLFELGVHEEAFLKQALGQCDLMLEEFEKDGALLHIHGAGREHGIELLEDYAAMLAMLLKAYECGCDAVYLKRARDLAERALGLFYVDGNLYNATGEYRTLGAIQDSSYEAEASVFAGALLKLGLIDEAKYYEVGYEIISRYIERVQGHPLFCASMASAAMLAQNYVLIKGPKELLQAFLPKKAGFVHRYSVLGYDKGKTLRLCNASSCFLEVNEIGELPGF